MLDWIAIALFSFMILFGLMTIVVVVFLYPNDGDSL